MAKEEHALDPALSGGWGGLDGDILGANQHIHGAVGRILEEEIAEFAGDRLAVGLAGEEVGVANKLGDGARGRLVVELLGLADLVDTPGKHHGHLVHEAEGLFLVVGDKDGSGAGGAQNGAHLGAHTHAQAGIEIGERLVEQDQVGLGGEGAGQGDASAAGRR